MAEEPIVRLRPVAEDDLLFLEQIELDRSLSEPFEWRGFGDPKRHRKRWEKDGYLGDKDSMLVVARSDNSYAGIMIWWRAHHDSRPSCVEIGILLHPDHRGQGVGTAAHRLLVDYLFETTTVHRIEAATELANTAEQRALEKAGFTREGVMRGRGFVRGEWQDGVLYSRLRTDPPVCG